MRDNMSSTDLESSIHQDYLMAKIRASLIDYEDLDGLKVVISDLIEFKYSMIYEILLNALKINKTGLTRFINVGNSLSFREMKEVPLIELGYENLKNPIMFFPEKGIFRKDLIVFSHVYYLYKFMEIAYFMNLGRFLEKEDFIKLYNCGLDERILFALNGFDKIESSTEFSSDLFIELKKVKWESQYVELFFDKLNQIRTDLIYSDRISQLYSNPSFPPLHKIRTWLVIFITARRASLYSPYRDHSITESVFIFFLAACSTVNDNRIHITCDDVLMAYNTYYKLFKVDMVTLVDKLWEKKSKSKNKGYLVCDKCESYYELQEGESPEDFSDECECGGKLAYSESKPV